MNRGELQQFYVTRGHQAIVDPELFDHMQAVLAEQNRACFKNNNCSGVNAIFKNAHPNQILLIVKFAGLKLIVS
jgi:hypothetical protein